MELFFKWSKQHLRIKRLFGTSENAVKTQIRITPGRHVVLLQGEGEPAMHPRFWVWAERLRKAGYIPYVRPFSALSSSYSQ